MKKQSLMLFVTMALVGLAASQGAAQQPADEVIRITKGMWSAGRQLDIDGATRYIADDYTEFNAQAATLLVGKDLTVRLVEAGFKDSGKALTDEMLNPHVQVYGDVAILTYNYFGVFQDKDGTNENFRAKSTRVYVKQGNNWMLVHANFGSDPVPNP